MKANELMIGDYVTTKAYPSEIFKVTLIDGIFGKIYFTHGFASLVEDVSPIPLTAEILEKNFTQHSRYKYDYCSDYFDLYITEYTDGLWCVTVDEIEMGGLPTWKMYVSNVHELQHALRLVGIEKEIVI